MANASETRIPLSQDTKEHLKRQKRGGETYDTLVRKMIAQYNPEEADLIE